MNIETNRLSTFAYWPLTAPVDPIQLAKAGLFSTGEGTEVQCFSCGSKISDWTNGELVMSRHRVVAPDCAFVVNPQLSGNVPLILEWPTVNSSDSVREPVDYREPAQDLGPTPEDEMYRSDALRLLSFVNWDDTSVSREALTSAGFYHVGGGRLRCTWCGGELAPFRNFGSLGRALEVHRMYFPWCTHAAALEARERTSNISSPSSPSYTPPLQTPPDTTPHQPQSSGAAHNERLLAAGSTWRSLGVVGGGARHPAFAALAARLATFERWPADRTQTPRALAEAGFFYTGTDDQVRCFYCDGGLGKWEAADVPWWEHAHWFPHCGFVLLVKGQQFVDSCRTQSTVQRCVSAESGLSNGRRHPGNNYAVTMRQVDHYMESEAALAALGAGLDAARVRRALVRRLRVTGQMFSSSEALIDAVLDEQLNEEAWSVSPQSQRLARDILAETLQEFVPRSGIISTSQGVNSDETRVDSLGTSPLPTPVTTTVDATQPPEIQETQPSEVPDSRITANEDASAQPIENRDGENRVEAQRNRETITEEKNENDQKTPKKKLTLEEENRQLKEARMCKVCMDSEVSVVFLPCGHLVTCGGCGAALSACPLCRCAVRALVRAYLA